MKKAIKMMMIITVMMMMFGMLNAQTNRKTITVKVDCQCGRTHPGEYVRIIWFFNGNDQGILVAGNTNNQGFLTLAFNYNPKDVYKIRGNWRDITITDDNFYHIVAYPKSSCLLRDLPDLGIPNML